MNSANEWLFNVRAFGGNLEPPPTPIIPTDYLQKPRRQPLPDAYLIPSPSTFEHASLASPWRRIALSDIDPPNQKRLRSTKAPAHRAMSQRSSRQPGTAENVLVSMTEAPVLENIVAAEEHTLTPTQDLNATPRPTRSKRAAPPLKLAPNLHTRPALVPTPSLSDRHVDEDAGDIELRSTHGSTTSKRSRSLTCRMVDLRIASKPVLSRSATSSVDIPQDVRKLYKAIQALARRARGVVPLGIEGEVEKDTHGDLDDLDYHVSKTPNGETHEQLMDEFKVMRDIRNETSVCKMKHLDKPSWNELVHSQMLKQAVLGRSGFSYYNITTARVIKELVPGNEYSEFLKGRMIDFAVTLGPPIIPTSHVTSRLAASPPKLQRTISPSDYSPLCYEPVVLSVETKSPDGGSENGEVQLSLWAMANFNRLRQLIQDPVAMTVPLLLVSDARWKLYFASDLVHEIHLIHAVDIGTTADIIGCYTVLEALNIIFNWVEETFAPWFLDGLKPE